LRVNFIENEVVQEVLVSSGGLVGIWHDLDGMVKCEWSLGQSFRVFELTQERRERDGFDEVVAR